MVRRLRTLNTVAVAALATAGIAAAAAGDARPCHPDLPGTRSLRVTGAVTGYRFAGRGTLVATVKRPGSQPPLSTLGSGASRLAPLSSRLGRLV